MLERKNLSEVTLKTELTFNYTGCFICIQFYNSRLPIPFFNVQNFQLNALVFLNHLALLSLPKILDFTRAKCVRELESTVSDVVTCRRVECTPIK